MPRSVFYFALVLLCAGFASGCAPLRRAADSPLVQPRMSPDSVVLEIFTARFPLGDERYNARLWSQVDEQQLDPAVRRRLAENGLRAGIVGAQMPVELQRLLRLEGQRIAVEEAQAVVPEEDRLVTQRRTQLRAGRRAEIVLSCEHPQFHLLLPEQGRVTGRTYVQGQGILALQAFPGGDGRVRLELTPELHHGGPRQQWRGEETDFVLETSRARETLDALRFSGVLAPGTSLLIGTLAERAGSVGGRFLTDERHGTVEQKLVLVRLAQVQRDDLFEPEN